VWRREGAGVGLINYLEMLGQNGFFFIIIVMVIRWIRQVIVYVSGMRVVTLVVSYKIENEALG